VLECGCATKLGSCSTGADRYCTLVIDGTLGDSGLCAFDPLAPPAGPYEGHTVALTCKGDYCNCAFDGVVVDGCEAGGTPYGVCGSCCFESFLASHTSCTLAQ
jgi:hypothetical protein